MECKNPNAHDGHICQIKVMQDFKKAKALSKNPQFYCAICEAESSSAETLCDPQAYKGKAGVLRWR